VNEPDPVSFILTVVESRNIPRRAGLESEFYCTIEIPRQPLLSTSTVKDSEAPVWNAEFPLTMHRRADIAMRINLWRFIKGAKDIAIAEFVLPAPQIGQSDRWVEMSPIGKRQWPPELHLKMDILPPSPGSPGKSSK
jgi:hypothetical protein